MAATSARRRAPWRSPPLCRAGPRPPRAPGHPGRAPHPGRQPCRLTVRTSGRLPGAPPAKPGQLDQAADGTRFRSSATSAGLANLGGACLREGLVQAGEVGITWPMPVIAKIRSTAASQITSSTSPPSAWARRRAATRACSPAESQNPVRDRRLAPSGRAPERSFPGCSFGVLRMWVQPQAAWSGTERRLRARTGTPRSAGAGRAG
jgi:hypothetical protein